MNEEPIRPNPDALLAALRDEESSPRGRLKVFLGMCPGVGKTYAMLSEAQKAQRDGIDVVVGVVETHGRSETAALIEGLEVIPRLLVKHRTTEIEEMDIDAILKRQPALVLVDELAHNNAPGSRHPKRYQDVQELIEAGLHVFTTINVQHLESQVDLVRQITGITVRETVPDLVLDGANEIELVDVTSGALRERLAEGKVYLGLRAEAAAESFFKEAHLTALREMALRYTAERVNRDVQVQWRGPRGRVPKINERLLVAIGPSPHSENLIRWTRRAATRLQCPWMAVSVETGREVSEADSERITHHLSLARRLGAESLTVGGASIFAGIVHAAREHHATQIVVGKPEARHWWQRVMAAWRLHSLVVASGEADVHIVRVPESLEKLQQRSRSTSHVVKSGSKLGSELMEALLAVGVTTLIGLWLLPIIGYWSIALFYLLTVVLLAMRLSRWPMLITAAMSSLAWDFLFIPPRFTFYIAELHDKMMFGMMFLVALVAGQMTSRLRRQELLVRERERRTSTLQRFTETLAMAHDPDEAVGEAVKQIEAVIGAEATLFRRVNSAELEAAPAPGGRFMPDEKERAVAAWVYQQGQPAGRDTDTLPNGLATWFPLRTAAMTAGVLGVRPVPERTLTLEERALLNSLGSQLAIALEKEHFMRAIHQAELTDQSNRLHKTLLDSVSHELKTPLAVLRTACETLQGRAAKQDAPLISEVTQATQRLQRVVDQLLDVTRLESGLLRPKLEWCDVRELCDAATQAAHLDSSRLQWRMTESLPFIKIDPGMFETALTNLLHNAAVHGPPDSMIEGDVTITQDTLAITVRDHGPGLPDGEKPAQIFEKFYRAPGAPAGGLGLGLSIVRGLAQALGGHVEAANATDGTGAIFRLRLPVEIMTELPESVL